MKLYVVTPCFIHLLNLAEYPLILEKYQAAFCAISKDNWLLFNETTPNMVK